ncbi:MAG: sensor histidine kinase [Eubacteriales bacterium]|jgi:signal transduction histidine kinase
MHKFHSIRTKLFVLLMLLVAAVFGVIALCQSTLLDSIYLGQKTESIQRIQATVVQSINGDKLDLDNTVVANIRDQGMCIVIYVNEQNVIYLDDQLGSQCSFSNYRHQLAAQVHRDNLQNPDTYSTRLRPEGLGGYEFLMIHDNLYQKGIKYSVVTSVSLQSMTEARHIVNQMLLWLLPLVLVLALIIALPLSRQITRPLLRMQEATDRIGKGDFSISLPAKGRDEIGQLEANFNRMAHDLSRIDALRRDLIANVSHDLRTPLTMIKGYAETIRDITGEDKAKRERQIQVIIEESDRLSSLISDVLALSKMQSGMVQLDQKAFSLDDTIRELLHPYAMYREQGYQIHVELVPFMAWGDQKQLGQVVLNLLNNAIKHTGQDGQVWLRSLVTPQGSCRVEVQDTGAGIDPEELPFIWDRYYKARNAKDKLMGTGIGLSIVKEVLNAHGLPYGVRSTKGQGTTFWFEVWGENVKIPEKTM